MAELRVAGGRVERFWFLATVAVTSVVFVDFCDLLFACGCDALWSGGVAGCNIHEAAGPHCPWCEHPLLGGGVAFLSVLAAQAWAIFGPVRIGLPVRLALAFGALPAVGGAAGLLQAWLWGYWN